MLLMFTILMELSHISFVRFTCVHVPDYQCQLWGEIILHAWPLFFARCSHLYIFLVVLSLVVGTVSLCICVLLYPDVSHSPG